MYQENSKVGIVLLLLDKIDHKHPPKDNFTRYLNSLGRFKFFLNLYAFNNIALKFIRQSLTARQI